MFNQVMAVIIVVLGLGIGILGLAAPVMEIVTSIIKYLQKLQGGVVSTKKTKKDTDV